MYEFGNKNRQTQANSNAPKERTEVTKQYTITQVHMRKIVSIFQNLPKQAER